MPPVLLHHVLTVLVFWSWVLLLPRLPPWSQSLRLFPWANILLLWALGHCLDLLPAAPPPPAQKRDAQHMFLQHRGAHAETHQCIWFSRPEIWLKKAQSLASHSSGPPLRCPPSKPHDNYGRLTQFSHDFCHSF